MKTKKKRQTKPSLAKRRVGPIRRDCAVRKYSTCDTADLHDLDWNNWFQDNGYIHVSRFRADEGETWHRVYPKAIKGRICKRIACVNGSPHWLHDKPNYEARRSNKNMKIEKEGEMKLKPALRTVGCVGMQPPVGYIQWHSWAEAQYKAGLRQSRCAYCGKWKFPQEMSAKEVIGRATTHKYGSAVVEIKSKVCNECAANGTRTDGGK